ncbi:hypothetical protein DNTS_031946 [Danionella cerebrum]|uniref:Pre-mRNA 3'-end-processing factor FIP1 n=1 Tax=Danionella cerebrum TaxID=2873325 RepID=A0A553PEC4_9TELE|nr:hypothetical protein DNTS_031946 [Danionella translucida]
MSTKELESKADESADDETDLLYGDDNFVEEETNEKEVLSALIGDVDGVNGLSYQGAWFQLYLPKLENLIISDQDTEVPTCSRVKGVDVDAEGTVLQVDVESFEEKPWRKPGADLSDYFNYGFNEDTWKAYCDKQRRLRMSLEILSLSSSNKILVHHSSNDLSDFSSSRNPSSLINVISGQSGTISRVEGRRRHSTEENNIQVVSDKSSDTELSSPKLLPFYPPNIPPPPFPPPSISNTPPLIPPPPGFPLPLGAPPPMMPTLDGKGCVGGSYDQRSGPPYPFPAGAFSPALTVASWPSLVDIGKSWENYSRRSKERMRENPRERGHKKERERERERYRETEREHSPSSQDHRSYLDDYLRRSVCRGTEITVIMEVKDIEKALEGKEQETDIEKEDKENVMNTGPHTAAVAGGVMIVVTQITKGDTGTSAPDTNEGALSLLRGASWIRRTNQRPQNSCLSSW